MNLAWGGGISSQQALEWQQSYPYLVVDTSLFPPIFQQRLLTQLSAASQANLDESINGVLIHSDNFQALNLLQARYREQVKCIYIDPPYNTGNDGFIYKDGYPHSSWLTLMADRLQAAYPLLKNDGVNFISIDDNEQSRLRLLSDGVYGEENFVADVIWQKKTGASDAKSLAVITEHILSYQKSSSFIANKNKKSFDINRYRLKDDFFEYRGNYYIDNLDRGGLQYSDSLNFAIECPDGTFTYPNGRKEKINEGWIWKWSKAKVEWALENNFLEFRKSVQKDSGWSVCYKNYMLVDNENNPIERSAPFKNLINDVLNTNANKELRNIFEQKLFNFPKPTELICQMLNIGIQSNSLILDYFAGSGTTAHAVINLNREDGGNRKYILVEQGEYFDTVLKPRVQKVIYSQSWKDGKPQTTDNNSDNPYNGVSQMINMLKLESYEDTLNNLQLHASPEQLDFLAQAPTSVQTDYLLHYMLSEESKGSRLSLADFAQPFHYQLNIATDSAGAYQAMTIDLVDTFNYLLGIRVQQIIDQREEHAYVIVKGILPNQATCLIVWRDCQKIAYQEIESLLAQHQWQANNRPYDVIYLNGDHVMANQWQNDDGTENSLKLRSIEAEFLRLMFEE